MGKKEDKDCIQVTVARAVEILATGPITAEEPE